MRFQPGSIDQGFKHVDLPLQKRHDRNFEGEFLDIQTRTALRRGRRHFLQLETWRRQQLEVDGAGNLHGHAGKLGQLLLEVRPPRGPVNEIRPGERRRKGEDQQDREAG